MKALTILEAVLKVLLVAVLSAKVCTIKLHASGGILGSILNITCYAVSFSWVLFTVIYGIVLFTHFGAWLFRKLADNKKKTLTKQPVADNSPKLGIFERDGNLLSLASATSRLSVGRNRDTKKCIKSS